MSSASVVLGKGIEPGSSTCWQPESRDRYFKREAAPMLRGDYCRASLIVVLAVLLTGCAQTLARTQSSSGAKTPLAELWVEPADLETRNLFDGVGGSASAPRPDVPYAFISEKEGGFSVGFHVEDPDGVEWSVKEGPEAQTEVVLSRILWAVGYHQLPDYYLPHWTASGGPHPGIHGAARFRPKSTEGKSDGDWSWLQNPFVGTEPFNRLVVILLLFNQWDFKPSNNTIYKLRDPIEGVKERYVVRDLGASLGRTPSLFFMHGTRNDLPAFERDRFVRRRVHGDVQFEMTIHGPERALLHQSDADVQAACRLLSRLTDPQWTDAFRAAGYDTGHAERFIRKIHEKIAEGLDTTRSNGRR
jgi:hypothetical protein